MNWNGIPVRVALALALGLLGPHPNIFHVGYKPLAPDLFRIAKYWVLDPLLDPLLGRHSDPMAGPFDTGVVYAFLQSYVVSCIAVFLLLTLVAWVRRRFSAQEQK